MPCLHNMVRTSMTGLKSNQHYDKAVQRIRAFVLPGPQMSLIAHYLNVNFSLQQVTREVDR